MGVNISGPGKYGLWKGMSLSTSVARANMVLCFTEETKIKVEEGLKNIEDIEILILHFKYLKKFLSTSNNHSFYSKGKKDSFCLFE